MGQEKKYFPANLSHLCSIINTYPGLAVEITRQVIQNCIRGQRTVQNELYRHYAPVMFMVCQRYANNREDAEDILQEGFIKIFLNLAQYRFNGSFEGWMRKIFINCALQKYRSQTHLHVITVGEHHENSSFADEEITAQLEAKELLCMVQQLPTACRVVFNLYVFEGMKHKEIAGSLGISEGTSKSNLFDARQQLQKAVLKNNKIAKAIVS